MFSRQTRVYCGTDPDSLSSRNRGRRRWWAARPKRFDTAHDLKPRQFQILGLLHDHGGLAQRDLVRTMGVDPSILVTLLNPLEAAGFVARERDPRDRRRHLVTLTRAGEQTLTQAARAQMETEDALFASLDDDQREQLAALLIALRDGLATDPDTDCTTNETA